MTTADAAAPVPGVRGHLISSSFIRAALYTLPGTASAPPEVRRSFAAWGRRCAAALGPASGVRAVADVALVPLLRVLGHTVDERQDDEEICRCRLGGSAGRNLAAVALPWGASPGAGRRSVLLHAIASDARWCLCCNGRTIRILDGERTWSRAFLEFDLEALALEPATQSLLWSVARAEAMAFAGPVLDRAVLLSARHGLDVCRALGAGVLDALQLLLEGATRRARRRGDPDVLFEQSLTVLYRILFLLFAEGRGVVPMWHPVYRDRYSIGSIVEALLNGRRCRGLWRALQAISRLAHAGCSAGELRVTAFNGRLFSPSEASLFDRSPLDDERLGRVVVAVATTTSDRGGRSRIAYRDLGVEQLGAVYEQVLDYQPALPGGGAPLVRTGDRRKATSTFYTPRSVTSCLVRRTLDPLLAGRTADEMLQLRILDPAMGSGAFLVAACRHLAAAIEEALIAEGRWQPHDVTMADRIELRRRVASKCLFGVDLNPMAVQLARLSLWLATLAADKPLSFLDHHLIAGDSLVGAAPADVARQPSAGGGRQRRARVLPLLDDHALMESTGEAVRVRLKLADEPDDSVDTVRRKEASLAATRHGESAMERWRHVLDLWCAGWFWRAGAAPSRGTFQALADDLLHGRRTIPAHVSEPLLHHATEIARARHFVHWPLTFPEVFAGEDGNPLSLPGFDAVIGNPPWDMIRGDSGSGEVRDGRRTDARRLTAFVRESGIYRVDGRAHANRYQLFVERALQLVRRGGRLGLVLPSGIVADAGAAPLRRHLFDRAEVDEVTGLDNRGGIFPIHRSVRFLLLTCTAGRPTTGIRCRFVITDPEDLDPPVARRQPPIVLTRALLSRLSGPDDLAIPEIASPTDLRIVERITAAVPQLSAPEGWNVRFGRELNASDDRDALAPYSGGAAVRPVVEEKQIQPFQVALGRSRHELRRGADVRGRAPRRWRLAYRDVASATNRLTLIAAVLPPRAVATHTLFCLKTPLPERAQHVLCALLNSYAANYLVRMRVNTHVTVALVSRLPVPVVRPEEPAFDRLADCARRLAAMECAAEESEDYAHIQALAARLYGLHAWELEHVLATFPLVPDEVKARTLAAFLEGTNHRGAEAQR